MDHRLRDYQRAALAALRASLADHTELDLRVLMRMACGCGKTVVFTYYLQKLLRRSPPDTLAVVVLPSLALMEQYQRDYLSPWEGRGRDASTPGRGPTPRQTCFAGAPRRSMRAPQRSPPGPSSQHGLPAT